MAAAKPKAVTAPRAQAAQEVIPDAAPIAADATRAPLSGTLVLSAAAGQSLDAGDMANAVVYFVPDAGVAKPKPGRFRIYTQNKRFEPESLVIPLGSTISFPNQDEILHNVFSVTPASSFDLGLYGEGKSAEYTFKKTGLVLINCNVHHAMQANVLVVDTPHFVRPGADGRFVLDGLPAGPGKLMVWHPRASIQTRALSTPGSNAVVVQLALTKPRVVEHLNKERKPYAPSAR